MRLALCISIFCIFGSSALENDYTNVDDWFSLNFSNVEDAYRKLLKAAGSNAELIKPVHTLTKPQVQKSTYWNQFANYSNGSIWKNQCFLDLERSVLAIVKGYTWVWQIVDSFGKPQSGLLRGETKWIGSYDECLAVDVPADNQQLSFRGKYAWVTFQPKKKSELLSSLSVGACFPNSCAEDDNFHNLYSSVLAFLERIPFVRRLVVKLPIVNVAFVPDSIPLSSAAIACICLCTIFAVLVLLGTLVDIHRRIWKTRFQKSQPIGPETISDEHRIIYEDGRISADDVHLISVENTHVAKSKVQDLLLCFSAISNAGAILDTSSSKDQLQCVHGIRFITMTWVILGHTYVFGFNAFGNVVDALDNTKTWPFQVIFQGTYSVDTFFLLSGCLLTYVFLKNEAKFCGLKHWVQFYIHRYVRLTPAYLMVLFIYTTWWTSLGNGPFWTVADSDVCSRNWWWNVLYINNFKTITDICMDWSWYLANDIQFFIISPIFLLAMKRDRIVGLLVVSVLLVVSWITTGIISRINNFPPMFEGLTDATDMAKALNMLLSSFDKIYDKPYTRIGPYLVGVVLGYVLSEVKDNQRFLKKWMLVLGWTVSQALSLALLYGLYKCNLGPATSSAVNSLGRSAWGLSVAWVIFICVNGNGGPVNALLSWKAFIPLSRLTYCAYLVHPMVIYWYYNSLKTTLYFSNALIVLNFLSFVVVSYGVAFVTSLLFESPFMKLEKFLKS